MRNQKHSFNILELIRNLGKEKHQILYFDEKIAMNQLSMHVARRLKAYRKQANMSVQELARRIHKSVATVYKYESGEISLDTDTLGEIVQALHVSPACLVDLPSDKPQTNALNAFLENGRLYAYYFDGRIGKVSKSLLTFHPVGNEKFDAIFYMHLKNFEEPEKARFIYHGQMKPHDTVSYFILEKITLKIETLMLGILHPFQTGLTSWGLFMGLSDQPVTPMATKMFFSKYPLTKNEIEKLPLAFTREELRKIRSENAILLCIRSKESDL